MTSPEALAILAKPKHERVAAVADLLRERDDLLRELVVKLDIYAGTATAQTPGALLSRVRAMRTFLLSIGVPVEDITDPPKWAAKLREAERLRAILRDISEALSGGEVPAEDLARTVAVVMQSNAAHLERVVGERDDLRARLAPIEALDLDAPRCRQCWTIPQVVEHSLDSDPLQSGVLNYWPGGWRLDCPVCGLDVGGPETTWPATLRDRLPEPILAAIKAAQGVSHD